MKPLRWVAVVLAAEVLGAGGASCSLNFDQFEPGKGDGAAQGDSMGGGDGAPNDSPFDNQQQEACTPSSSCLGTATTCKSAPASDGSSTVVAATPSRSTFRR